MNKLNDKQKDLISKCAVDICEFCDNADRCQDVLECDLRMTLEGLSDDIKYIAWDGELFMEIEESKGFTGKNPFI
ncbi:hypothetical protein ACWTV9_10285 [Clostridioides difficile]|nr:hypothetical protein KW95_13975 [Clostridioides difficile]